MATLRNRSHRTQSYNLPHDPFCGDGTCRCEDIVQHTSVHDQGTGAVGVAQNPRKVAASLSFFPGETKEGLPEKALRCPDIVAALARGELVELKPEPARPETKPGKRSNQAQAEA